MKLNNTTILNIEGLRKNFNINEIIELVDTGTVLLIWLKHQKAVPMADEKKKIIDLLEQMIECRLNENQNKKMESKISFSCTIADNQLKLQKLLCDLSDTLAIKYRDQCTILFMIAELADYTLSDSECSSIRHHLMDALQTEQTILNVEEKYGKPRLMLNGTKISDLLPGKTIKGFPEMITTAQNSYSGFIGIDYNGCLVNGSRFEIKRIERKAVKVAINSLYYVILLDNGEIVHNMDWRASNLITAKDFLLVGDKLSVVEI